MYKGFSEKHDDSIPIEKIESIKLIQDVLNFLTRKEIIIPKMYFLYDHIKKYNPDIIFIKITKGLRFFLPTYLSIIIGRLFRIKIIILEQERKGTSLYRRVILKLYSRSLIMLKVNAIIVPTLDTYNIFSEFKDIKTYYIPFAYKNGFEVSTVKKNMIDLLTIGKFTKRKNQILLLKAFSKIHNKYDVHLTIVGQEKDPHILRDLKDFIENHSLKEKITIKTNVPYDRMGEIYSGSDIFILPSYAEPAAYSIVESMYYGIPVICSDDCGTRCYVIQGENGFVFKNNNEKDLIKKIEMTIRNIEIMRENTTRMYKMNHQEKIYYKRLKELRIL